MSATQSSIPSIILENVSAGYTEEKPVFENISFTIEGPAIVHLKGRNGSGKSTFVELASGYLKPWSGNITVSNLAAGSPQSRSRRRVCRSTPALFAPMTVKDHIVFACIARDTDPQAEFLRVTTLGMAEWLDENAGNLSTGNTRKLWYLINTVGEFDTILLDEPFNGVDTEGVDTIVSEIRDWAHSKLVVIITHSLESLLPEAATVTFEDLARQSTKGEVRQ